MSKKSGALGLAVVEGYVDTLLREDTALVTPPPSAEPYSPVGHSEAHKANLPPWAQQAFQMCLFHSGELMFAVALRDIDGVVDTMGSWLLPAPQAKADWLAGIIAFEGRKVAVIDPYNLILPAPYRSARVATPTSRITRILVVGEGRLAIAMDRLEKVVTLRAQEVVWRGAPGQRPWLRGVVRQPRGAVLDCDELANLLAKYDIVV